MNRHVPLLRGRMPGGPQCSFAGRTLGCCLWVILLVVGTLHAEMVDRVIAIVNDDIILQSDLNQTMTTLDATLDEQGYSKSQRDQILREQRGKILEQMIYDKLTDQQVKQHNIKIGDDEVDAAIERIGMSNRISGDELRRRLESEGLSYEEYRKQIKEKILRSRLVNREVKSKIVVTDEDIKAYYEAHSNSYGVHTKYELRHIMTKVPPTGGPDARKEALARINQIYDALQKGGSFEKLAREYSEAPSAARDGYLGILDLSILSEPIKQALGGLEARQFTGVVDSEQGYQIFYVESVIQTGGRSIEDVRSEIHEKLFADVVDRKFNEWIKELRKRSHIQILE